MWKWSVPCSFRTCVFSHEKTLAWSCYPLNPNCERFFFAQEVLGWFVSSVRQQRLRLKPAHAHAAAAYHSVPITWILLEGSLWKYSLVSAPYISLHPRLYTESSLMNLNPKNTWSLVIQLLLFILKSLSALTSSVWDIHHMTFRHMRPVSFACWHYMSLCCDMFDSELFNYMYMYIICIYPQYVGFFKQSSPSEERWNWK